MPVTWSGYSRDDQEILLAADRKDLSLSAECQRWRMLWHCGPIALTCHLRAKYKLNDKAYMRSFRPSDADSMHDAKRSFAYFVSLETALLRRAPGMARARAMGMARRITVKSFIDALAGDGVLTRENDFGFVSVNFEGKFGHRFGIMAFGLATLDTGSCLKYSECASLDDKSPMKCLSYGWTTSASRHYLYGTTTKMDVILLAELVADNLSGSEQRRVG